MNTTNINQEKISMSIKRKMNEIIVQHNINPRKLLQEINNKYNCEINKTTWKKTLSEDSTTVNTLCLIYFCKYFNLDLNNMCNTDETTILSNEENLDIFKFPLRHGKYKIFMRNPDFFTSEICEGTLEIIRKKDLPISAILTLPLKQNDMDKQYISTNIINSQRGISTIFLSSERGMQVILHLHFNTVFERSDWRPVPAYQGCFISDYNYGMIGKFFVCDKSLKLKNIDKKRLSALLKFDLDKIIISKKNYMELERKSKKFHSFSQFLTNSKYLLSWDNDNYIVKLGELLPVCEHIRYNVNKSEFSYNDIISSILDLIFYSDNPQKILINNDTIQRLYLYNFSMNLRD